MAIAFDQYQRYFNTKKLVEIIKKDSNKTLKILEVGANEHQLLEKFLPNDDITYLDIELPERLLNNPKYILGDATDMKIQDNEYDIVIALDVFEHIPKDKREKFIRELYRVSSISFIVAAPFYSLEVQESEKRLNELFKVVYNIEYRWLQEHISNRLPDINETKSILEDMDISYSVYEHGNLSVWEKMTRINFLSVLDQELCKYREYIDDYYNNYIEPYDYSSNSYRKFIIGYKKDICIDMNDFKSADIPKNNMEKLGELEKEFNILFNNKSIKQEKHEIVGILKNFISEENRSIIQTQENILKEQISILQKMNLKGNSDYIEIYIKNEDDYSEENTVILPIDETDCIIHREIELGDFKNIQGIRIDPSNKHCAIKIISIKGILTNGEKYDLSKDISTNADKVIQSDIFIFKFNDPQILIEKNVMLLDLSKLIIEIEYIAKNLKSILILEELYEEKNSLNELINKFDEQNERLIDIINEKERVTQYLNSTLEHVKKLEQQCTELTIKGRIKKGLKKIGISRSSMIYLLIKNPKLLSKGLAELKKSGISGLKNKIKSKELTTNTSIEYINSESFNNKLLPKDIEDKIKAFTIKPKFSIIMPVYNVDVKWLEKAIASVTEQTYPYWEICIADDCSTKKETIEYLEKVKCEKIKVITMEQNGGISKASNSAVKISEGEYLVLMDNDDEIREEALFEIANAINEFNPDVLYSDEDKISTDGVRRFPFMKPDWSPDLLYSQMYICHLLTIKKNIFEQVGGFRSEFDGSQDYDLILRISEITENIYHIPKVLYSWREIPTSTAMNPDSKPYAHLAGLRSLDEHLKRKYGSMAYANETEYLFVYDARFKLQEEERKISIIIPTKDKADLLEQCINSILLKTKYSNYEILIINNNSQENETYEWFKYIQEKYENIRVIDAFYEFNWSKLNNHGIREAKGDVYVFLNNDTIIISEDWLTRLAENSLREDVGTVGALLLYEDGTIQHAGVVLGMGGWADHVFKGMKPIHFGSPYVSPMVNRNVLASTGACLAISKKTIDKIGDFDEKFIICGSDVEISIRARKHNLNNIYNCRVKLYHLESKSRDSYIPPIDFEMSKIHYKYYLDNGDPYYNKQLDLNSTSPKLKE
ncbi:glycosyltransferase [Clostridium butyricum]|uniref:glycosyltransferase n=1 Tax=Clostridium butyricum TaxID=1492 RepID=UPI0013D7EAD5|nr:glycosyltransferase [Clostridium butyricum]MCQ2016300.1 glycosyltransferase [Clostridium butyricum]MCQ2022836.1 glycosyltransferase [Clostridium butyricum]NFB70543.1 glycosyltransferase [Clostridium butyricum]NFB90223.1 glycosyltransferase [Clostridium butyricum]UTY54603.1 glycosyltransferase [Clostridium butyricum]